MKLVDTKNAVGHILCHDITQIVNGVKIDTNLRKGHVITEEDIPALLNAGKDHVYIWENDDSMMHENDAAAVLKDILMGENIVSSLPKEGKIEMRSEIDGVLIIDKDEIFKINSRGQLMAATRQSGFPVKKGDLLVGTKIVPLVIEKEKMDNLKNDIKNQPIANVYPYKDKKIGVVTTGNEVYYKRIEDKFTPIIKSKFIEFGASVVDHVVVDDNPDKITKEIDRMLDSGIDIVVCSGGMSVDPDDKTPLAIKNSKAEIVRYGSPVSPGAMLLLAYTEKGQAVIGLPGCVMYAGRTIFDLILPSIMADIKVTYDQISEFGYGGLCLKCDVCHFPNCMFGK